MPRNPFATGGGTVAVDLIAHRGFVDAGPENTLPTLSAAQMSADAVEFDVRLAGDGTPVVFHDQRVDRLTAQSGPVAAFAAEELRSLSVGDSDATIPTLGEVLAALSEPIVVDLKVDQLTTDLIALLQAYGSRMLVSSPNPAVLEGLPQELSSAVLVVPPTREYNETPLAGAPRSIDEGIEIADAVGAAALHVPTALVNASRIRRAQSVVFAVNAWTIRDRETAAAMRAAGVDGLIVDSPEYG